MIINFQRYCTLPHKPGALSSLASDGDTIVVNGDPVVLTGLIEGGHLPASAIDLFYEDGTRVFFGHIERTNGQIMATLMLPYLNWNGMEPQTSVVSTDGPIHIPDIEALVEEVENGTD